MFQRKAKAQRVPLTSLVRLQELGFALLFGPLWPCFPAQRMPHLWHHKHANTDAVSGFTHLHRYPGFSQASLLDRGSLYKGFLQNQTFHHNFLQVVPVCSFSLHSAMQYTPITPSDDKYKYSMSKTVLRKNMQQEKGTAAAR